MAEVTRRLFAAARAFAHSLKLANRREWRNWAKLQERPSDIPANPERDYKSEWQGWGDWLGTGTQSVRDRGFWSFEAAREYVHALQLANYGAWQVYRKSGDRPPYIPSDPAKQYGPLFRGYPDWLGTDGGVSKLPFLEARAISRSLGAYGQQGWQQLCREGKCPPGVPRDPAKTYKGEFKGYRDWTGTENFPTRRLHPYLSYSDANTIVLEQRFRSWEEWEAWSKTDDFPKDLIPLDPRGYYKEQWEGVVSWIGTVNRWTRKTLLKMVGELQEQLPHLEDRDLCMVLEVCGALPALRAAFGGASANQVIAELKRNSRALEEALMLTSETPDLAIADLALGADTLPASANLTPDDWGQDFENSANGDLVSPEIVAKQYLALDALVEATYNSAGGIIDDLIRDRVQKLWALCIDEGRKSVEGILDTDGGRIFLETKRQFFAELVAAESLVIPNGYAYRTADGLPAPPNLMQRHIAATMLNRHFLGNWSGAGAGKSLGGILASRVLDARLTIVVTNNATVDQWRKQVLNAYPDSAVYKKFPTALEVASHKHGWLVLNYEKFQLRGRNRLVEDLLALVPDFLILDEVHFIKQREFQSEPTKRRDSLLRLRSRAAEQNPKLRVLVMSGTPVLNDLAEANALLQIETNGEQGSLDTKASVANGLKMFYSLLRNGFRYRPRYEQETITHKVSVTCNNLLPTFVAASGNPLTIEQTLLEAKLEAASSFFENGTIVYTHYISGIVGPIRSYLEAEGFRVGVYTGFDKSGLEPFKEGQVDVLIASEPIGIGIDELQYRSNRLVFISLPWTGAMYEQVVGRLLRQGSRHNKVDVVIPQIVFAYDEWSYSWDRLRLGKIQRKQTLSECAVNGTIPDTVGISRADLQRQSQTALQEFLIRIRFEEMLDSLRNLIVVPDDTETG